MAVYYFRNTGNVNWGTATNWSLSDGGAGDGAVPTAADDAIFTSNSGNCTTDTSARVCLTLICTGYTNTLTLTNTLTVSGTITLSSTMTISGAAQLILAVSATITSNGCNIPNLRIGNTTAVIATCGDVISVTNIQIAGNNSTTFTVNNNTINVSGNFTLGTSTNTNTADGTTSINLVGTGTWSQNVAGSQFRNPININTSGVITCGSTINYGLSTLTYTSGTVNAISTTLTILTGCTLNTSIVLWGNVTIGNSITVTLSSDLLCSREFRFGNSTTGSPILNGNNILVFGNLITQATSGILSGTTTIVLSGNGSITMGSFTTGYLANNLTINTNETITLIGNFRYRTGTFTYISGKFIALSTSNLLLIAATTLIGVYKIKFATVTITNGIVITMDNFFSGSPTTQTIVRSSSSGSTYTISFTDLFEKVCKFVDISDCVLSRPMQLLVITQINNTNVRNVGIRYINQSPNSIPKGLQDKISMTYPAFYLTSDPTKTI